MRLVLLKLTFSLVIALSFVIANAEGRNCDVLLESLAPHLSTIHPVLGKSPTLQDYIPPDIQNLISSEGGTIKLLGSGSNGIVYRWFKETAPNIIIKYYATIDGALRDDILFNTLARVAKSDDYIKILKQVRTGSGHLRFYEDIRGITFKALSNDRPLPSWLHSEIEEKYRLYISELPRRLSQLTEVEKIVVGTVPHQLTIIFDPTSSISQKRLTFFMALHKSNIIFESNSGYLWIVDPN